MIPADLHLVPSTLARYWFAGLHVSAAVIAAVLPLPWCIAALLVVSGHFFWQQRARVLPVYLHVLPEGELEVFWPDGLRQIMSIKVSSVITSWLLVLHLAGEGGGIRLVLWPDSACPDGLRQWRVWLRWQLPRLKHRQSDDVDRG